MGGVSNPYASGSDWKGPSSGWRAPRTRPWARLTAAVGPWIVASAVVTAMLNTELAPRADQTDLPEAAPPPPSPPLSPPGHSDGDDMYFDPAELISV